MRKILSFFFLAIIAASISACSLFIDNSSNKSEDFSGHSHSYDTTWSYDETCHWHESTCGHDVISSKSEHIFNDVDTKDGNTTHTCTVCGYSNADNDTKK